MIYLPTALELVALDDARRAARDAQHAVLAREAGFLGSSPLPTPPRPGRPGRVRRLVAGRVRAVSSAALALAEAACSAAARIEGGAN